MSRFALGRRRMWVGFAVAAASLTVATVILSALRTTISLPGDVAIYLLLVIVTSLVGGFLPALACALVGSVVLNYFLVPPLHTLSIDAPDNVVALVIFALAGILVSRVVDLSERRSAQAVQAGQQAQALASAERTRTALLNAVSHDLRTPIAAAKAAVSGLRSTEVTWSDTDRAELLATADESLDRLTDLVTNLLDLSRLQAGVLPVRLDPVGLDDVVARALDHLPATADVQVALPEDLPEVRADGGLLERVVANLAQNALRYAPPGTSVVISGMLDGSRVLLRVADHGRGIDPIELPRLFAPFQRTDDVPTAGAGVGLGLAIVRGFVDAMGGEVHAERTEGGGATLVVALPAVLAVGVAG